MQRTTRLFASSLLFFTSLSADAQDLIEVINLAIQNDPNYKIAEAEYRAALEQDAQSSSAVLPQIDVSFYSSDVSSETSNATGSFTNGSTNYNSSGYELTLTQTLFDKRLFDALDRSEAEVAQATTNFQSEKLSLLIRVTDAYFSVLTAQDDLIFAQAEKKAIAQQLEQAKERFDAGLTPIIDVKEAQAKYDLAIAQEVSALNQVETADEALVLITLQPIESLAKLNLGIQLDLPEPNSIEKWRQAAAESNLEIRAARYALRAASETSEAAHAGHYPTVNLNLSRSNESSDGSAFGGRDIEDTRLSLNLDIPIYSGGFTNAKYRETLALQEKARIRLDQVKKRALQKVNSAFRGIGSAISKVKALKNALESTRAATAAIQAGFEVGTRTSVDVLLALQEQHKSERDYKLSLYDYVTNSLELKAAAGTLSVDDFQALNRWFQH